MFVTACISISCVVLTPKSGMSFAIGALIFQWISMLFFFLGGHFLLSASELGGWTREDETRKAAKALNDISLSMPEKFTAPQLPINRLQHLQTGKWKTWTNFNCFTPFLRAYPEDLCLYQHLPEDPFRTHCNSELEFGNCRWVFFSSRCAFT